MVAGTTFESSIKSHQRTRNGRRSYLALCQHNMGSSKWDKIVEDAETYVMKREWNGRNHRFTLKSHISKHREAHNEMVRASDYINYEVPNEHTRVGRLMKSLTSRDANIVAAVTHIHGSTALRDNFEDAADFILLTAPNNGNAPDRSQRVSAVGSRKSSDKSAGKGPKTGVELRYHSKKEYRKLSREEKKELGEYRSSRNENSDESNSKIAALEQVVKKLEATISSLSSRPPTSHSGESSSGPNDPLTNPLSQRQVA